MLSKKYCPIGVDLGSGYLRLAQLGMNGQGLFLQAAGLESKPDSIQPGSPEWQRWALGAMKQILRQSAFKGKKIVTALPSDDLFIDQVRISKSTGAQVEQAAFAKVQNKLPFKPEEGIIKYITAEHPDSKSSEVEVLVMAAQREKVDLHLAIYEKAGLEIYSINTWPFAMINSYSRFFCRRKNEQDRVSILMEIGTNHCNVVICRGSHLLFARVIPIGFNQMSQAESLPRMIAEVDACGRYYETMPGSKSVERLVFLSGSNVNRVVCDQVAELAQRMQIAAQIGDVLSAVRVDPLEQKCMVDRRNSRVDWAMSFGLSLDGLTE
jgi:Tfp pilus assembly PilM family ATPase